MKLEFSTSKENIDWTKTLLYFSPPKYYFTGLLRHFDQPRFCAEEHASKRMSWKSIQTSALALVNTIIIDFIVLMKSMLT